jgi:hypothetical protein
MPSTAFASWARSASRAVLIGVFADGKSSATVLSTPGRDYNGRRRWPGMSSVFRSESAEHIANSLKRPAERSTRRKGTPYQSAMSMLNFYVNRAGSTLPPRRKATLERAKRALRRAFGR